MVDLSTSAGFMELGQDKKRGALDPRTVSRSQMLERLGDSRPSLSLIILASPASEAKVNIFKASVRSQDVQIIVAYRANWNTPVRVDQHLETDDDAPIDLIRRAGHQCVGRFIVLLPPDQLLFPDKAPTLESFAADPNLAATLVAGPRGTSAIVIREIVWSALDGLDPSYVDWGWSVRDFCLRARAIGYFAPDWPISINDADEELFRHRCDAAPTRSSCSSCSAEPRVVLYTAIANCYDTLKPQPHYLTAQEDRVAFLDQATLSAHSSRSRGWRITTSDPAPEMGDPHRRSRYYKINSHHVLPEAPFSLWVDASIGIVCPYSLSRLAELFLSDHDLCVFSHDQRQSIYEEAEACKIAQLDDPAVIDAQVARYRFDGLPSESGLIEAPILLRRHSTKMMAINDAWWAEIQRGSRRDQLSFNYVAWLNGFRFANFPLTLGVRNGLFVKFRRSAG
jgi:Protein of unknown function (DUF616)